VRAGILTTTQTAGIREMRVCKTHLKDKQGKVGMRVKGPRNNTKNNKELGLLGEKVTG